MTARQSVAVIGMGGIGGIAAGCLQDAGRHDVVICSRRPMTELTLDVPGRTVWLPLRAATDPAAVEPVDWVLLCTKAYDTASTAPWLARLCRPGTRIAVLQNGIDQVSRVAPVAAGAGIVPTVVYYNGEKLAPDHVRLRPARDRDIAVAEDADGRAFATLLDGTLLRVSPQADFTTVQWRKLLLNAASNPITALTRQRLAVLRRDDIHHLCRTVLDEAIAVASAAGAEFAAGEAARIFDALLAYGPEPGTSMYFDVLAGRRLEADMLTGAIVRAGRQYGIPTPVNGTLLALLQSISDASSL
ncbi:MAG: 2-dehydropantoate 2-reductase [Dongiaceae bacterium]